MNISKAMNRDRKRSKRLRMVVDNKSIFTLEEEKRKRAEKIRKAREDKELALITP